MSLRVHGDANRDPGIVRAWRHKDIGEETRVSPLSVPVAIEAAATYD
jgi:hypothetical protein